MQVVVCKAYVRQKVKCLCTDPFIWALDESIPTRMSTETSHANKFCRLKFLSVNYCQRLNIGYAVDLPYKNPVIHN
jgi:hypothetical protein